MTESKLEKVARAMLLAFDAEYAVFAQPRHISVLRLKERAEALRDALNSEPEKPRRGCGCHPCSEHNDIKWN